MSEKKFFSYDEQLNLLERKGLEFPDRDEAIRLLKEHSYFDLINGYKYPFKKEGGNYKLHTTFEDIHLLYCFDDDIRFALIRAIMEVEIHIKSLLSYAFCECFGSDEEQYLNPDNYNCLGNEVFQKFKAIVQNTLNDCDKFSYMKHQKDMYGNVPLWVLVKALTFGTISKMYSFQKPQIQVQICKEFKSVSENALETFLDLLTRFRNVCAHNERLFDYKYYKRGIVDTDIHAKLQIGKRNGQYKKGKSDFFAALIALKYLLSESSFNMLIDDIDESMERLFNSTHQLQPEQLYKYMGLPSNWREIKDIEI